MKIQAPTPDSTSVRLANGVIAALHFLLVGMVLYLRLGPIARVLRRMEEGPAEVPGWMPTVFTGATILVAAFLVWRGTGLLRRALRAG